MWSSNMEGHSTVRTNLMNLPRRITCDEKDSEAALKLNCGVLWLIGNACHRLREASKAHVLLELNTVCALQSKAAYSVCYSPWASRSSDLEVKQEGHRSHF